MRSIREAAREIPVITEVDLVVVGGSCTRGMRRPWSKRNDTRSS